MDAHMIGAVYTRLHLSQAYGLMFLGGFCSGLFWVSVIYTLSMTIAYAYVVMF